MPPTQIPPQLKILTAFIRRAEELDQEVNDPDSSLIAYYCRSYAVDKGIKLRIDDPAVNTFLFSLMDTLESSKKSLPTNDSGAAAVTCENYAYNIFSKADDEYRSGESTKDTARQFYAASTFYDILEQFGPLDEEVLEKRKYSKWKAADIMKAVSSGQRPVLPEMQAADSDLSSTIPAAPTIAPMPVAPFNVSERPATHFPTIVNAMQAPPAAVIHSAPPQQHYIPPPSPAFSAASSGPSNSKDAIELAAFAIAALKHNDVGLAKQRLTDALRALE